MDTGDYDHRRGRCTDGQIGGGEAYNMGICCIYESMNGEEKN